ncbi:MAG: AzlD domain-containing protein [Spirochaetales bacterium]|nr:AzlD domain-containing protein [Spirochaetales bacterium]
MKEGIIVAVMAVVTILLRFLPFIVFRKQTPPFVAYLGKVLPAAIIGMLVIYCLKDTAITVFPFGLQELISIAGVVGMQVWKRNSIMSILTGTVMYMILIRIMV